MKTAPIFTGIALLLALGLAPAAAQERSGTYWGLDLGAYFPQSVGTDGNDDDVGDTRCDEVLFSAPQNCPPRGTDWENRFDMSTGMLGGLTIGYMLDNFRFEFEYLYRTGGGDASTLPGIANRRDGEFVIAEESLSDFESHHLFANVYYDFLNDSKFTPYFGIGVGWASAQADYEGLFVRNSEDIFRTNFQDILPAAGTVTRGKREIDDDGFGYQLLVGVDYWLAGHLSLGMKLRYAEFDGIDDGRSEWDILRSHASEISPGGDRVTYEIDSNDIRFWGASLNLKYRF